MHRPQLRLRLLMPRGGATGPTAVPFPVVAGALAWLVPGALDSHGRLISVSVQAG